MFNNVAALKKLGVLVVKTYSIAAVLPFTWSSSDWITLQLITPITPGIHLKPLPFCKGSQRELSQMVLWITLCSVEQLYLEESEVTLRELYPEITLAPLSLSQLYLSHWLQSSVCFSRAPPRVIWITTFGVMWRKNPKSTRSCDSCSMRFIFKPFFMVFLRFFCLFF